MFQIDRRMLVKSAAFGLGAMGLPGLAAAFTAMTGFTHGVASGEPSTGSVLLWTRFVGTSDSALTVEMAATADFAKVVAGGTAMARGERDHIAKIVLDGLEPGRWYFYRFVAPDGSMSPIGRTRTLPAGATERFNLGVFSCSNMPFGWFNAYAHCAARSDIDLVVHLGDYFYEYGVGTYPSLDQILPGRMVQPDNEIVTLTDYRLRYQSYRADPDLQRLHQVFPMVAMWDDHELANDAWMDGAQNHQPETEGDWVTRKRIAERVYREWMPVRDLADGGERWTAYQIGDLATLFMTESRITGRVEQLELAEALAGRGDIEKALAEFRDGPWQDPGREMLGAAQADWFGGALKSSVGSGTKWQVWGQQCLVGTLKFPQEATTWVPDSAPDYVKARARIGALAAQAGLPFNFDSWDGYPAARRRALTSALEADANLIVLTGDSHNGWAFDLDVDGTPAGVEFAGQSVTSPGFETFAPTVAPADMAKALVGANDQLKWADTSHRGYMTVSLTSESATSEWHALNTIGARDTSLASSVRHSVAAGSNRIG